MNNKNGTSNMLKNNSRRDMLNKSSESHNSENGGAQTPQYIIQCKEFFGSDIEGFEDNSTPCLWIEVGSVRLSTYDSSGELFGDGRIITRDPIVCMKYGSWAPIIQQYMFEGKNIPAISVKRFVSINGTKVIIQELNYDTCLMKTYEQDGDTITFTFCFVAVEDVNIAYDHEGKKLGNTATKFDTGSLKITNK
jgi:hypothetical protein